MTRDSRDTIEQEAAGRSRVGNVVPLDSAKKVVAETMPAKKGNATPFGNAMAADGTLRCRFEMKYQISESKAAAVEHYIQPYLHPDRYCKLQPTGNYPLVSLYLDSSDLKLCRESITGKKNRFKLRIRGYNDDPAYPKFFEIKRRLNFVIIKDRQRVNQRDVAHLLSGGPLPEQYYSTEQEPLKQFLFYMRSLNARPLILIRYIRRAYEDNSETRVRVTFDRELSYRMCDKPIVSLGGPGWQRHPISDVVLEIKFTSRYPAWLTRMAECLELRQQSFSKYTNCVNGASTMRFSSPDGNGFDGD
jgi:hypothetical protein